MRFMGFDDKTDLLETNLLTSPLLTVDLPACLISDYKALWAVEL